MNPLDIGDLIKVLARARDKLVCHDYDEAQDAVEYALSCLFVECQRLKNLAAQPRFVCPQCRAVSFNPNDIANRYCARCHQFYG
jgi:hypothetical protein